MLWPDDPAGYLIEIPGHVMALAGGKVVDNTWRTPTTIDNEMLAFMRSLGEEDRVPPCRKTRYMLIKFSNVRRSKPSSGLSMLGKNRAKAVSYFLTHSLFM